MEELAKGKLESIQREKSTDENRRIDLVLNIGSMNNGVYTIGIENKPWAHEQKAQAEHYTNYLNGITEGKFVFIYLHGKGDDPLSIDKKQLEKIKNAGQYCGLAYYPDFFDFIIKCYEKCRSERYRYFLKDFADYITNHFGEEKKMGAEITMLKDYIGNKAIDAAIRKQRALIAFSIKNQLNNVVIELQNDFLEKLKNKLEKKLEVGKTVWAINFLPHDEKELGIRVYKKEWGFEGGSDIGCSFCFAFCLENKKYAWAIGVKKSTEIKVDERSSEIGKIDEALEKCLKEELKYSEGKEDYWLPWKRFPENKEEKEQQEFLIDLLHEDSDKDCEALCEEFKKLTETSQLVKLLDDANIAYKRKF